METTIDSAILSRDHDGQTVVFVPLENSNEPARLLPEDYDKLVRAGISARWAFGGMQRAFYAFDPGFLGGTFVG